MSLINLSFSKYKIIAFYVTTTLIGIALIYVAVFNATQELEIIHESNTFERLTRNKLDELRDSTKINVELLTQLAENISTKNFKLFEYKDTNDYSINNITFDNQDLKDSIQTTNGGYFIKNNQTIAWSTLAVANSKKQLLIAHIHHASSSYEMFNVYKNRLIIPAVFFIWMTVWGGLILSHLISSIHKQKEQAEHSSLHDTLTGLPNRKHFTAAVEQLCDYSKDHQHSFCMAVVDLDDFKTINDTYGHNAGDEILIQAAKRFQKTIRTGDLAARLGGDEFILLLPNLELEAALVIFNRIHTLLTKPYIINNRELKIGASIGVSLYPNHSTRPTELIRRADLAMYTAKKHKTGIEVYDESLYTTSYLSQSS